MMRQVDQLLKAWNRYWFTPSPIFQIRLPRLLIGLSVACWFLSYFAEVSAWFGENGVLHSKIAAQLIAYEEIPRWQVWSPLWWTDSLWLYQLWLVVGTIVALLLAVGIGGRVTVGSLLLLMIAWAHRTGWLAGIVEPALVASTGYLLLEPGKPIWASASHTQMTWTANATMRLWRIHWWILVAALVLNQMAGIVWWRGDAVWWLAASGRSTVLSIESLAGSPLGINALTHSVVIIECLALFLVQATSTRRLGVMVGVAVSLVLALIADQWLYALTLLALVSAYWKDLRSEQ